MDVSNKLILDLCGGTGSWARPFNRSCVPYNKGSNFNNEKKDD